MLVTVTEYDIICGLIIWRISSSIKTTFEKFSQALTVFHHSEFKIVLPWKYVKVTMYNIRNGGIRWQIRYFLFDGNSNDCSLSHYLRVVRKLYKMPNIYWTVKMVKVVENKNRTRRSTGNMRFRVGDFFTWKHILCKRWHTHTHTHRTRRGPWLNSKPGMSVQCVTNLPKICSKQ